MRERINVDYAIVSAFERSKRAGEKPASSHAFGIALFAVFFVIMMGCLAAGANIYSSVSGLHAQADDIRLQSGLLANAIRVNDAAAAYEVGEGPEGDALVLVERLDSGTFETRVYGYEGAIVQEYALQGRPYNPKNADKIVDSSTFEFSCKDGLVTITTDVGVCQVALRSAQDAPAASGKPAGGEIL